MALSEFLEKDSFTLPTEHKASIFGQQRSSNLLPLSTRKIRVNEFEEKVLAMFGDGKDRLVISPPDPFSKKWKKAAKKRSMRDAIHLLEYEEKRTKRSKGFFVK